jgi:hypothetical protein
LQFKISLSKKVSESPPPISTKSGEKCSTVIPAIQEMTM